MQGLQQPSQSASDRGEREKGRVGCHPSDNITERDGPLVIIYERERDARTHLSHTPPCADLARAPTPVTTLYYGTTPKIVLATRLRALSRALSGGSVPVRRPHTWRHGRWVYRALRCVSTAASRLFSVRQRRRPRRSPVRRRRRRPLHLSPGCPVSPRCPPTPQPHEPAPPCAASLWPVSPGLLVVTHENETQYNLYIATIY